MVAAHGSKSPIVWPKEDCQYSKPCGLVNSSSELFDENIQSQVATVAQSQEESIGVLSRNDIPEDKSHDAVSGRILTPGKATQKVLTLNANGTLGSPHAQKRTISKNTGKGSRIVVCSYGGADCSSRLKVGEAIDDICCNRTTGNFLPGASRESSVVEPQISKATHPFFLPKSSKQAAHQPTEAEVQNSPSKKMRPKNTIACSTPSKIQGLCNVMKNKTGVDGRQDGNAQINNHGKQTAVPGFMTPLWPPLDMQHIKLASDAERRSYRTCQQLSFRTRHKLKSRESVIGQEECVLREAEELPSQMRKLYSGKQNIYQSTNGGSLPPHRRMLTLEQLQAAVLRNLSLVPTREDSATAGCATEHHNIPLDRTLHAAIVHKMQTLKQATSAFDNFSCEPRQWTSKFAPEQAGHVLQTGSEATMLRDWLRRSVVSWTSTVQDGDASCTNAAMQRRLRDEGYKKRRAKRRKKALDDFVVTSDEELGEVMNSADRAATTDLENLADKGLNSQPEHEYKTLNEAHHTNTLVISGPHGCGKSAAVYAAAKELDFEVFEINPGSRRSGRDIVDRVGDMARNHLVHLPNGQDTVDSPRASAVLLSLNDAPGKTASRRQQSLRDSCFVSKSVSKKSVESSVATIDASVDQFKSSSHKRACSKQSLILIEEADVLFEEDKQFWSTITELTRHSRRPIIITCSEERLLPLDELLFFAVLRFTSPPDELVTDYLLLMAAIEGHLLSRECVKTLYKKRGRDLRASITDLNFHCQMAVGDEKCGLDWRLAGSSCLRDQAQSSDVLRAISVDTYHVRSGCPFAVQLCNNDHPATYHRPSDTLMLDLWEVYGIDAAEYVIPLTHEELGMIVTKRNEPPSRTVESLDQYIDALSVADVCCPLSMRTDDHIHMDTSLPRLTESISHHFTEDASVLQAEPIIDFTGLSIALASELRENALQGLQRHSCGDVHDPGSIGPMVLSEKQNQKSAYFECACLLRDSLAPLSLPPKASLRPSGFSEVDHGTTSAKATDLAPYVRSILNYDLRLAERRQQLEFVASQTGGQQPRARRTRASWAALEGGSKSSTRREKWFENNLNIKAVLTTGGLGWSEAASDEMAMTQGEQ